MFKSKKFIVLILTLTFLFCTRFSYSQDYLDIALDKLTEQINQSMLEQKKTKIAILPFPNLENKITKLGSYFAEELTTNLFMTGKFKIVERSLLKQVLDELKLSQTGVVDPDSAKELGKMAGVDSIVAGTTADLGSYVAVNCRLIETETGNIFAAASVKILKDEAITKLLGEVIEIKKVFEKDKVDEEQLPKKPFEYDATKYFIQSIGVFRWIDLEFLSFIIGDTLLIKAFFVYTADGALNNEVRFTFPNIVDDQGNTYRPIKVTGDYKEFSRRSGIYTAYVPIKGRLPIFFEFPMIPNSVKKIWFNFNKKSVEINWQNVWKSPLHKQ